MFSFNSLFNRKKTNQFKNVKKLLITKLEVS